RFSGRFSTPAPDSGTFLPVDADVFLSAGAMFASTGSPTAAGGRHARWLLPDGSDTRVVGQTSLPASWSTFDVYARIARTTSGSGDVALTAEVWPDVE